MARKKPLVIEEEEHLTEIEKDLLNIIAGLSNIKGKQAGTLMLEMKSAIVNLAQLELAKLIELKERHEFDNSLAIVNSRYKKLTK